MSKTITSYVGLDVHKDSIAIAVAAPGREAPRFIGTVGSELTQLSRALRRIAPVERLQVVYEAGPCGYALARHLSCSCAMVTATPARVPGPTHTNGIWPKSVSPILHRTSPSPSIGRR